MTEHVESPLIDIVDLPSSEFSNIDDSQLHVILSISFSFTIDGAANLTKWSNFFVLVQ